MAGNSSASSSSLSSQSSGSSSSSCVARLPLCLSPGEKKSDCCPCECGGDTGVCPTTGAVEVNAPGIDSSVGRNGPKYSSGLSDNGTPSSADYGFGFNWLNPSLPSLCRVEEPVPGGGTDEYTVVIFDSCRTYWFSENGSAFDPEFGLDVGPDKVSLVFLPGKCRFQFVDCDQNVWEFNETGKFTKVTLASGRVHTASDIQANGIPAEVSTTSTTESGETVTDSNKYEQAPSGSEHEGRVTKIKFSRSSSPHTGIQQMVYSYYGSNQDHGSLGDLKSATLQLLDGTTWVDKDVSYYRYYKAGESNGFEHGIKYVLGPKAFVRLKDDPDVVDPFTAPDEIVAKYADRYFEYNASQQAAKAMVDGQLRTFMFAYATSSPGAAYDFDMWKYKTTTTRPDGSTEILYSNYVKQPLLRELVSGAHNWIEYYEYDSNGNQTLYARPAAVNDYTENADGTLTVNLKATGFIQVTDYYATTEPMAGAVEGYVQFEKIKNGSGGSEIKRAEYKYSLRTVGNVSSSPVAEQISYRDDSDEMVTITTSYSYTWYDDSTQIKETVTTLPVIPESQNGTGDTHTQTQIFDQDGKQVWEKSPRGFISYNAYDAVTQAITQSIQDVDMSKMSGAPLKPSWTTPTGGGLHLVTDYQSDELGETTQTLGPTHNIEGQAVRTASWTVRKDLDEETWSARGYATGTAPHYEYTLVNPVSISRESEDGLTIDTISAARAESMGELNPSDEFPQTSWVRWSRTLFNLHGQQTASRTYHSIPHTGEGQAVVNYDESQSGYDRVGRQNMSKTPAGTIRRTVFDVRGLPTGVYQGTNDAYATDDDPTGGGSGAGGNNMLLVSQNEYDGGSDGGDGNLTQTTRPVDGNSANDRVANFEYDWRDRQTVQSQSDGLFTFKAETTYDNLDQPTVTEIKREGTPDVLIAKQASSFDNLGRVYQRTLWAVDDSGNTGNSLTDNTWYDADGNVIKSHPIGSESFTKTTYDGVARATATYLAYYNGGGTDDPSSLVDNIVIEQSETIYDETGNVTFATRKQRYHNATGTGALNGPNGPQPKSRDSYVASWYDGISRMTHSADYGTNDDSGPPARPDSAPASSDVVLVGQTTYNVGGEVEDQVDPAGMVMRTLYDNAGRQTDTISNFVEDAMALDENLTTRREYHDGHLTRLIADNAETGEQVTAFAFGVSAPGSGSEVANNDLLRRTTYPDGGMVTLDYNRQNDRLQMEDQNGSVHGYTFDKLGRLRDDEVTTLGAGVDGTVRKIRRSYNDRMQLSAVTSLNSLDAEVNFFNFSYNDFGQIVTEGQNHLPVGTLEVAYDYEDGSTGNTIRLTSVTYPDPTGQQVLSYVYNSGNDDKLSRVSKLSFESIDMAEYSYLGRDLVVYISNDETGVDFDLGANSNYDGLDRFGRIQQLQWSETTAGDRVDLEYGYDRASNRTFRRDALAPSAFSEAYGYDSAHRLNFFARGQLNTEGTTITNPTIGQSWQLDPTGNWKLFQQSEESALLQHRTHNAVNEITDITESVGASWATPVHDANGNMTTIPQPGDPTEEYTLQWDAWNRLVKVSDEAGTVAEYAYDGIARRIWTKIGTNYRHYFYSGFQVLEERTGDTGNGQLDRQYVWGIRYIDDLIMLGLASGTRHYALQDGNWNVVALVDTGGAVKQRYAYQPYGIMEVLEANYTSQSPQNEIDNAYTFTGRRHDSETGLYYYRARYYNPTLGRFLTRDLLRYVDGMNLYRAYFIPNFLDPFGDKLTVKDLSDLFKVWVVHDPQNAATGGLTNFCYRVLGKCEDCCMPAPPSGGRYDPSELFCGSIIRDIEFQFVGYIMVNSATAHARGIQYTVGHEQRHLILAMEIIRSQATKKVLEGLFPHGKCMFGLSVKDCNKAAIMYQASKVVKDKILELIKPAGKHRKNDRQDTRPGQLPISGLGASPLGKPTDYTLVKGEPDRTGWICFRVDELDN